MKLGDIIRLKGVELALIGAGAGIGSELAYKVAGWPPDILPSAHLQAKTPFVVPAVVGGLVIGAFPKSPTLTAIGTGLMAYGVGKLLYNMIVNYFDEVHLAGG
jgi:hypothetical protein